MQASDDDDEIFFGAVSKLEEELYSSIRRRKTELCSFPSEENFSKEEVEGDDDDDTEIMVKEELLSSEAQVAELDKAQSPHSSSQERHNTDNLLDEEMVLFQGKRHSSQVTQCEPLQPEETESHVSVSPFYSGSKKGQALFGAFSEQDVVLNNNKGNREKCAEYTRGSLCGSFEDLRLETLPPEVNVTITPEKATLFSQLYKRNSSFLNNLLSESAQPSTLKESTTEHEDPENVCIPPTPCNSTAEFSIQQQTNETTSIVEGQYIPITPCNSTAATSIQYSYNDDIQEEPVEKDIAMKSGVFDVIPNHLEQSSTHELAHRDTENKLSFSKRTSSSLFSDSNLEIITLCGSDETNLGVFSLADESSATNLENVPDETENIAPVLDEHRNGSSMLPVQVPEMTERQQEMLRKLWSSPDSVSGSPSGSPLMNALDLSTKVEEQPVQPVKTASPSLSSLDLSVDDRIPVEKYVREMVLPAVHRKQLPAARKQTPMKVISHKIGIVNIPTTPGETATKEEGKDMKYARPSLFKNLEFTPRSSGIPVPTIPEGRKPDFKMPRLPHHGINMYKSKVRQVKNGKLFTTPQISKTRSVMSPVAKYIHEDEVPPLVKVVRPKELKVLPIKTQDTVIQEVPAKVSVPRVPVAHYKPKHRTAKVVQSAELGKGPSTGRLFPSPYTPKVAKHEGARRRVPGVNHLNLQKMNQDQSDSTDSSLERSTTEIITLKRTRTLFKPIN